MSKGQLGGAPAKALEEPSVPGLSLGLWWGCIPWRCLVCTRVSLVTVSVITWLVRACLCASMCVHVCMRVHVVCASVCASTCVYVCACGVCVYVSMCACLCVHLCLCVVSFPPRGLCTPGSRIGFPSLLTLWASEKDSRGSGLVSLFTLVQGHVLVCSDLVSIPGLATAPVHALLLLLSTPSPGPLSLTHTWSTGRHGSTVSCPLL